MFRIGILIIGLQILGSICFGQVLTKEDSLAAGLIASDRATVISGYGSAMYENNLTAGKARINLDRVVLFVGHKFNNKVSFFSELELEDAKVAGDGNTGEISMEQAFIKFNIDRNNYITAGLFIPRIGIINENHLPTTFNGNRRPFIERYVIPATWRELGVGYYGTSTRVPGLNYSLALINGLSSANFETGKGLRSGRFEGSDARASALAVTGSILHYFKNLRSQISAYYGGTAGITNDEAKLLNLKNGIFGTPVSLVEANVQYQANKVSFKGLISYINIADADKINAAYANNTPEEILGCYLEAAYKISTKKGGKWTVFGRYEYMDMQMKRPSNAISDLSQRKQYVIGGIGFQPVNGVLVKLDYTYQVDKTYSEQNFINLGIGYSF